MKGASGKKEKKEMKDRISGLTNDILVNILSFLPTKHAIHTTLLSKRWKRVWESVPVLDFDYDLVKGVEDIVFINFVDRVLLLHDLPLLYKFSLKCCLIFYHSKINAWISMALKRRVQELHLCIISFDSLAFPCSLFISDTLTTLKIDSPFGNAKSLIKIPAQANMPTLKFLHLNLLQFSTYQSTQQVSLSFPMLQEFELQRCEWKEIESVVIVAPTLETLVFHDFDCHYVGCKIKVYAGSLKSLVLISLLSNYLNPCNLTSLAMACIHIHGYKDSDSHYITNIVREISGVNRLAIFDFPLKLLSQAQNSPLLLNFSSLVQFEVNVIREDSDMFSSEQLIEILYHLPRVEDFQFQNYELFCALVDSQDASNEVIRQDGFLRLKLVELKNFHGSKNELVFVKYLLNNARALNEMSIISVPECPMEVTKELLMFGRKSNCAIRFT